MTPISQTSLIRELVHHTLFGALSETQVTQLAKTSTLKMLGPDYLLFSKGDSADFCYLILSGELSIEIMSLQGKLANIAVLSDHDIVGEFTILDDGVRSATARCLSDVMLLCIPKSVFLALLEQSPDFAKCLIGLLILRLRKTNNLVEGLTLMPLRQRLLRLLYAMGRSANDTNAPIIKTTQAQLADRLSASREKVNKHLRDLQDINKIEIKRGTVKILSMEYLMNSSK